MITEDNWFVFAGSGMVVAYIVVMTWMEFRLQRITDTTLPVWPKRTCGNCRWFSGDGYSGRCFRRSPVFHKTGDDGFDVSKWPTVSSSCWCGEHEYKVQQESESAT